MSKLRSITPPVWIFLCTLLLIVVTGGLIGGSPCERSMKTCQASAAATHPDNASLQQAYIAECSAPACSTASAKTSAFVPFSLIILGFVMYQVWLRQGNPASMSFAGRDGVPGDALPAGAAPGMNAPSDDAAPVAAKKKSPPKKARKAAAAAPPEPAPAPKPEPDSKASGSGLKAGQEKFCLSVLADTEKTRDDLNAMLGRLTGSSDPDHWKGGPMNDMEVLARGLAMAALIGPEGSKYRSALTSKEDLALGDTASLEAMTKKALHEQCVATFTGDLQALVDAGVFPSALSPDVATAVAAAARAADGLDGISRCSKAGLVHLAAFLGQD